MLVSTPILLLGNDIQLVPGNIMQSEMAAFVIW